MKTVITFTVAKGFCDPGNCLETTADTDHRAIIDTDLTKPTLIFEARDTDALGNECWRRSNFVPDAVVAQIFLRLYHREWATITPDNVRTSPDACTIAMGALRLPTRADFDALRQVDKT